jgi:hypothetical protein
VRTIRNITFVVLCAMVYVDGGPTVHASSQACSATYAYTDGSGGDHYQGECYDCDNETYFDAIDHCSSDDRMMVEYFCSEWFGFLEYVCVSPWND